MSNKFKEGIDKISLSKKNKVCSACDKDVEKFKDNLSIKEYRMSGLCQECQDNFFEPSCECEHAELVGISLDSCACKPKAAIKEETHDWLPA